MSLDQFSTILSVGSISIFILCLGTFSMYFFSKEIKGWLEKIEYEKYIYLILIISIMSVVGTLIYQLIYKTPVCELCWWQRIFLYPIVLIALVNYIIAKSRETHIVVMILSFFGLVYSSYHYYYHYMGYVLGRKLELPCSAGGLMPACTDSPILIFGFITIPFMGIMMFGSLLLISILILKIYKI